MFQETTKDGVSARIGRHFAATDFASLGADTVHAARRALLDAYGVMLAATGLAPDTLPFRARALADGGRAESRLLGDDARVPAAAAAFANGALGHALDFGDTFDAGPAHPNAALVPALLALSDADPEIDGGRLIAALALGSDLACRISLAPARPYEEGGWYPPPFGGMIGAAAACARLIGLDADGIVQAIGLSLCQASFPGEIKHDADTRLRGVREAFAARSAVSAALLAQGGVRGFAAPLEGQGGFFALHGGGLNADMLLADLGTRFLGDRVSFKPWPCCRGTHAYIEAALALRDRIAGRAITRIDAETGPVQDMLIAPHAAKAAPVSAIDAKFSIPFTVAVALVHGAVDLESFGAEQLADAAVLAVARQVVARRNAGWGRAQAASGGLTIVLADGDCLAHAVPQAAGHPDRPMNDADLIDKFARCAAQAAHPIADRRARDIAAAILSLGPHDRAAGIGPDRPRKIRLRGELQYAIRHNNNRRECMATLAEPRSGTFDRLNPVTGGLATTAKAATVADANAAVDAAAAAFLVWSALGPNARRALLTKAADALAAKADDFVAAMMGEIGATEGWARFNLMLAVGMVREAAALTTQIGGEVIPSDKPGCIAMALREPVGVMLGIAPWNAPIILGVRAVAVPLACGNTVVLKASEQCPRTHELIAEAFAEAGLPEGAVSIVTNAPADAGEIVGALIDHPEIKRINFTGSTHVGRIIAQRAAGHLKPVLLELGGKAPLIVLDDADLDEAVKAAAFGAFMNSGQICMSTERIIVVDSVADAFVEKFAAKVGTMPVGDPREGTAPLGAVVDQKTVDHVQSLIDEAKAAGAVQVNGGPSDGVLMPAHVIDHVTPDMKLFRDESFGPVVGVIRARDERHAIELANDTEYGLSAAVFTRDTARGLRVARRIKSGICHVNGSTVHDEAQMPFGGIKSSGYGRFGGRAGIDAFTELRWITIETEPGHYPI